MAYILPERLPALVRLLNMRFGKMPAAAFVSARQAPQRKPWLFGSSGWLFWLAWLLAGLVWLLAGFLAGLAWLLAGLASFWLVWLGSLFFPVFLARLAETQLGFCKHI